MLQMVIKCLGVFQSFKLAGKPDPQNIADSKKRVYQLISNLSKLSEDPTQDYLDANLAKIVSDGFCDRDTDELSVV